MYNSRISNKNKIIYIKARGKVNLNLHVFQRRVDNYHNLESVFQKINLYDELYVSKNEQEDLVLTTNVKELENKKNIISKAYYTLKDKYKQIKGVTVKLNKNIPMQAGLGGGSTDCSAFILAMNKLYELNMNEKDLIEIGSSLGADVVPCFYNSAVKANGIGDRITKINTHFKYYLLVIKPNMAFSTKEMYTMLDNNVEFLNNEENLSNTKNIIKALEENDINLLTSNLYNSFENVVPSIIQEIKQEIIENGANNALMAGSGSSVYGIFKNKEMAKKAYRNLKSKYETYYAISYNK